MQIETGEEELLLSLTEEERKRRVQMRSLLCLWLGVFAGFAVLMMLYWWVKGPPDLVVACLAVGAFSTFPLLFSISSKHQNAALQASLFRDPRFAPRLLDVLDCDSYDVRKSARAALLRILPLVTEDSRVYFDRRHLHQLGGLAGSSNLNLATRAITALAIVGDQESIRDLELLQARRSKKLLTGLISQSLGDLRLRLAKDEVQRSPYYNPVPDQAVAIQPNSA